MFRLKSSSGEEDQSESTIDALPTPSATFVPGGIFGALEPAVSPTTTSQFTIPALESKWNQVVEYQLSDGKKVLFFLAQANLITRKNLFFRLDGSRSNNLGHNSRRKDTTSLSIRYSIINSIVRTSREETS